ncbi:MAG: hypothetical protein DRP45_06395 [Candidatus Zixiibacteriota bacterium]|nr:MAG: hypothetical protein DRP45_06395 [candidate division Zixibacteria bacterium]
MASLKHNLEYLAAAVGFWTARRLSPRVADKLGATLGSIAHSVMSRRRHLAFDNLKAGMGNSLSDAEISKIVKRVFQNTGRSLIEIARFGKTDQEDLRELVEGAGLDGLKEASEKGRGGIVATAHFGNWEMMGAWVGVNGYPIDLLVATQSNPKTDRMIRDLRRSMGSGAIDLSVSARRVFKSLQSNRFIGIACDQYAPARSVSVNFFGRPASAAKGPALFALRCGCPILPFLLRRVKYDRHVMIAGDPIYSPKSGDEEKDVQIMTERYMRFFEEQIRRYPDQWLWTHDRWKKPPQSVEQSEAAVRRQ